MAHHQQLLDWIENELINQNLHLGDELPDDRALAREVGISQNLMRESLKHCEEIGVLRLYEGRKKSIIGVLVREPASSAGPAIGLYLASSRAPRQDLLNTCLLLESYALAGPSFDESAFPELDRIVLAMQDADTSLSDFHDLEADFHIQLGRLSGNALVSALLATLRDAMIEARFELVNRVPLWSATSARLRMEYRAIVDAARSGDPALAQTLLRANLHERFAEAGHQIDLPDDVGQEAEDPQFILEPVDIDANGLVPEEWGGAIEPDLFQALTTIQPIKSSATPVRSAPKKNEEQPAPEPVAIAEPATLTAPGIATVAKPASAPETPTEETSEVAENTAEAGAIQERDEQKPRESAVSEQPAQQPERPEPIAPVEERAVPTGSATRKRRGTVSPAVHATVIPPRQTTPKPVPVQRLTTHPLVKAKDKPAVVAESTPVQADSAAVAEDREEKLRREEARLAAAKLARQGKTAPAEPKTAPVDGSPSASDAGKTQESEPSARTGEGTFSEPKRPTRVASKKLFDVVNYFGFKQMKSPARSAQPTDASEGAREDLPAVDGSFEHDGSEASLLEGYEYIAPPASDDEVASSGSEGDDQSRNAPWQDSSTETQDGPAKEPLQEQAGQADQPAESATSESAGNLLGQKKAKKKSKKNRR